VIELAMHAEGTILPVKAHAGARRNAIRGETAGMLSVSVIQVPEKGKANQAIVALLCKTLGLRASQLELLSGDAASQKRFLVRGVAPSALALRIDQALIEK
jgi:hypothetical protein